MLAEFFCLTKDVARAELVEELVRKHVDQGIDMVTRDLQGGPIDERNQSAIRYGRLLQATFPLGRQLSLTVRAMDWMDRGTYISIYWPIFSLEEYWSEIEGTRVHFEALTAGRRATAYPDGKGMELFFPALAIHDRMVLVPKGQSKLLLQIGSPTTDNVERDVLEVDFRDADALDFATLAAARELRQQVRREVTVFSSRNYPGTLDIAQAATYLRIPAGFIELSLTEVARDVAERYQRLSCDLEPTTVANGRWTKTMVVIGNESGEELQRVTVYIQGPVEFRPTTLEVDLPAHSSVEVPISIRPTDIGDFPIEITLVARTDRDLAHLLPRHHVWLQSVTPTAGS